MITYVIEKTFESGCQTSTRYESSREAENVFATSCAHLGFGEDMLLEVRLMESSEYGYVEIDEMSF